MAPPQSRCAWQSIRHSGFARTHARHSSTASRFATPSRDISGLTNLSPNAIAANSNSDDGRKPFRPKTSLTSLPRRCFHPASECGDTLIQSA